MKKQKNFQLAIIAVLTFAVLFMSVGFAAYSRQLEIAGTTSITANKWSVHFDRASLQEVVGSVDNGTVSLDEFTTTANFTAKLAKPGDFYAFTVNVINDGTFDAILKTINITAPTQEQDKYLNFTVSYDGTEYAKNTDAIDDVLNFNSGNNTKPVTVRVEFDPKTKPEDLPNNENGVDVSLGASFGFTQAQ